MNIKERKIAVANIKKQAILDKTAEDAINNISNTENYGHQIFEELLNNLQIDGLEDLD